MPKTKVQKQDLIKSYVEKMKGSTSIIVVSPTGLTPNEVNEFKKELNSFGSSFNVVKNTLFARALEESGLPKLDTLGFGTHAAIFVESDVAGVAKKLKEFMTTNKDKIELRAGILEGQALDLEQVKALSEMPTKQESIGMIAGILTQAIGDVANVLEDPVRSVVIILDQAFKQ